MSIVKSSPDASGNPVKLFFQEYGTGKPVIFIHGWPLNHEMWEYQLMELPKYNLRCIAYDRRGFGKSSRQWEKYDYDTLAEDLKAVIDTLNLEDVTLVGFSMGGGEIARYIGNYGTDRISKVVLISAVTPYMLKTEDNPEGVDKKNFDEMVEKLKADRPAFLAGFAKKFYGVNMITHPVSQEILDWNQAQCLNSSAKATIDCVRSFSATDFREDVTKIDVPTLIIHGDEDKTVPIAVSGDKTAALLPHATYLRYDNAPHGLFITEREKLNTDLINFINGQGSSIRTTQEQEQSYRTL
ncbi:MAG: alpha/beta hydrolase [Flavobacteriales bacterium]|nr:alpha/beta hydrolase [Flavobacteriales bacterium]